MRIPTYTFLVMLLAITSCIPTKDLTYLQESESGEDDLISVNLQQRPYRIQINDVLSLRIKALDQNLVTLFNPASSANQDTGSDGNALDEGYYYDGFAVDSHGEIRVPTLGEIKVLGYTTEEIRQIIEKKLLEDYFTEEANIFVTVKLAGIKYTIAGEVASPGVKVELVQKLSLMDAIANSGDILITGNRKDIVIVRQYPGGQKVHHLDLTKIEAMQSPYYNIQPNDLILVNPLPQKSLGTGTTGLSSFTTVLSIFTALTTVVLLFTRL
ncbi:MAG: polysaccharide biosynthesis/export family protein [Leeuwenhoekiella sp.]